jgi:hypothetical protein
MQMTRLRKWRSCWQMPVAIRRIFPQRRELFEAMVAALAALCFLGGGARPTCPNPSEHCADFCATDVRFPFCFFRFVRG